MRSVRLARRFCAMVPLLTAHLGKLAPASDVAVALNTALMGDGAVIRVAAGATIERPLHLLFVASEKPAATFHALACRRRGGRPRHADREPRRAGRQRLSGQCRARNLRRRRGPCRSRQDDRRRRRRAACLDARRRDRRACALQHLYLHRGRRRGAQSAVPEIRRRGHGRRHSRRDPGQGPSARRHDARRQPHRARLPKPRSVQGGARRRGPWRIPGPHHRAPACAKDRRQDDDARRCCSPSAPRRINKPELEIFRRRRAMRPRRDRRRAR